MKRPLALLLPLLGLLAACANPGRLAPRAEALAPEQLVGARSLADVPTGAWPTDSWWTAYGDPQLDHLMADALRDSPSLTLARARLDQARAMAGLAAAADGVQVGANAEGTQQRLSENYIFPPSLGGRYTSLNRAALDFSLDLDFWGRNRAALDAAVGQARAAQAEAAGARLILSSAITRAYLQFDRLHQLRAIADATVTQREKLQELVRLRLKAGLENQADLRQADGSISAARAERSALDVQLALVRNQLAALTGHGPDAGLDLTPPALRDVAAALPSQLPADLLGRRPDVNAQRWRVEASRRETDAARVDFYPNVNLSAFVGLQSIGLSNLFEGGSRMLGVGPAIHLPVFDSGRLRSRLAERNAEQDLAIAQYNATLVDALRDVADQLASWRGADVEGRDQQAALARYEDAWRLTEVRYKAGLASYTAVLAAETPLLAQRRLSAELRTRRLDASAGLARALGGGYLPTDTSH